MINMQRLANKIVVVTGASRGIGRGIAQVLGEHGATVIVTGRSISSDTATEHMPGNITETAELVTKAGGTGIPIRCDHTNDIEVEQLFQRIKTDFGRIDMLVNNIWGGYENEFYKKFSIPFWEQPIEKWDVMFNAGLRAHFTASKFAVPLMIPQQKGIIINISAGDLGKYLGNVMYDVVKNAIDRLAFGMSIELKKYNIAAISLHPGFARTERVMAAFVGNEAKAIEMTESPSYIGRGVAALAEDEKIMDKTGKSFSAGILAIEYGFTDIDGRKIAPFVINLES